MIPNYYAEINTLHDVMEIMKRWKRIIWITFFAIFIPAFLITFLMPPLFEATGTILVNRRSAQEDYAVNTGRSENSTTTFRNIDKQEEINTIAETIKARKIVESMSDKLTLTQEKIDHIRDARRYVRAVINFFIDGFKDLYSEVTYFIGFSKRPTPEQAAFLKRENLFNEVKDRLNIMPSSDANIINISFRSSDPFLARDVVNELLDQYLASYNSSDKSKAKTFFSEETTKQGNDLAQAEGRLAVLKEKTNAYSIEKQRMLLLGYVADTLSKQKTNRTEIAKLNAKIAQLKKNMNKPSFKELLLTAEVEIASLGAEEKALKNSFAEYQQELANLTNTELQILKLERQVKILEESFMLNVRNREQAGIIQERKKANLSEIQIADYASLPMKALQPKKLLYLGVAFCISIILSIFAAFLAYFNDSTITTSGDIERHLGLKFVSVIDDIQDNLLKISR